MIIIVHQKQIDYILVENNSININKYIILTRNYN